MNQQFMKEKKIVPLVLQMSGIANISSVPKYPKFI